MAETAPKKAENTAGTVSVTQLAEVLDCSTRTVEKYAEQGLVIKVSRGRYHFLTSIRNVVKHLRKQASLQVSQDGKSDQISENVAYKAAQRRMAEMKIAEIEGKLISVAEVEDAWAALVAANRQLMLSVPNRVRMELPDITGHEQTIIQQIVRDLLTETSLGEGKMPGVVARKRRNAA